MYDIVIVGAGTAGLTAAVYAARAGRSVAVFEGETIGGQISYSPKVENYPGFSEISGSDFSDRLSAQAEHFGAELLYEKVQGIEKNGDGIFTVHAESEYLSRVVILATGTHHRHLGVLGEDRLIGSGVSYCAICDGAFFKNKVVAVIGGGNAALQSTELLSGICSKVYLVVRRDVFRGEATLAERVSALPNVELILLHTVSSVNGESKVESITVKNAVTSEERTIPLDGVFIMVGQSPDNGAFASLVELDDSGYIVSGESTKTSCEGIFAAGDCRVKTVRQLTTAASDGTVAAMAASDYLRR